MKVLHAAVEYFPLVKTGGLADVMGALPKAQQDAGADVRLVLPGLPAIMSGLKVQAVVAELGAVMGAARVRLLLGSLPDGLQAYVIDAPLYFARTGSPYLNEAGKEWSDSAQRFALLGWVAAHLSLGELDPSWQPQVLHAHDWHAAMACAYLAAHPVRKVGSVFTVHNLAYQGLFDGGDFHLLGLPARFMTPQGIEFHGQFSFMKAGLHYADRITTVSPTYASEMAQAEFGWGLDGLIRARKGDVQGILNGVDPAIWDPANDGEIPANFSAANLKGKAQCKAALQEAMGLKKKADVPLFGIVSRLTSQKGLDLVLAALPTLVADGAQLAVLGSGDAALEAAFRQMAAAHPEQVAVRLGYDEAFAHQMMAGIDSILVPSRFEPCGLTQLYGLRYGAVPVVRHVGGLADTVTDASEQARNNDKATGFVFGAAHVSDLIDALRRTIQAYSEPKVWKQIQRRGMAQNFSWARSAEQYLALYDEVLPG